MFDTPDIAEWSMTEETIPERPNDPEWRRSPAAIRLAYLAALVVSLGAGFFVKVKLASILSGVALALAGAFHFRCWLEGVRQKVAALREKRG